MNGLSHRTWLHCSVQESWWKVPLVLNVREKSSTLTLDGSAVAHLGQYGTGVHMKITDEMVPCPVCGWMRNHTSLSWSKWARLLTCWNNHSESESLWRLWFFFFTELFLCTTTILFLLMKKKGKKKIKLNCCWLLLFPPIFVFNSGKFQWGVIGLKKGGEKFSGKLQMEETLHDDKLEKGKKKKGNAPVVRGRGVHVLFSPIKYVSAEMHSDGSEHVQHNETVWLRGLWLNFCVFQAANN